MGIIPFQLQLGLIGCFRQNMLCTSFYLLKLYPKRDKHNDSQLYTTPVTYLAMTFKVLEGFVKKNLKIGGSSGQVV